MEKGVEMVSKTYRNDVIASGGLWRIDPTRAFGGTVSDYMKKFAPFNSLFVANEDTNEIELRPNGSIDRKIVLPQGATRNLIDSGFESFSYVDVVNNGLANATANKITIRIEKINPKVRK